MDEIRSEQDMQDFLYQAVQVGCDEILDGQDVTWWTFEEQGVLTMNKGLVIRTGGHEYQITIVRSA